MGIGSFIALIACIVFFGGLVWWLSGVESPQEDYYEDIDPPVEGTVKPKRKYNRKKVSK